jgi:hypothetical protein
VKKAARVENYRGFVFASLASSGPSLKEFLGKSIVAFDDMCDRAPKGEGRGGAELLPRHPAFELEAVPREPARRAASVRGAPVHRPRRARSGENPREKAKGGAAPLSYHMLSAFATVTIDKWDDFQTINYPYGHCILTGYMGLRPQDPDTLAYDKS